MYSESNKIEISASIVLYKNNVDLLKKTISSFLEVTLPKKLFLIDNSPTDKLRDLFRSAEIEYIFLNRNIGFGAAHNLVISKINHLSKYHLILNPDVSFDPQVINNLINVLERNIAIALIAPKIKYLNGDHQYSCRRYPSFLELFVRRVSLLQYIFTDVIANGEYRDRDLTIPFFAEYLSGCFQLFQTKDFVKIYGFDERYFLYMEDVDICKKIDLIQKKKLYYPSEFIYHKFEKGSSKNIKLFFYHIVSVFKYFYKWKIAKKFT